MQENLALEPNKPYPIIRVLSFKIIHYCQTALARKQVLQTPPVLLKNVGQSPRYPNKSFTASAARGLSPLKASYACREGKYGHQ